ncbi:acyl-CoA synthetase (NDP forming) [Sphingobium jiangsuense]|uniref:Acyl-CoA synthetase (NDP forming) n=2 Tax=Sphingobium jiangsuense TaxID=870476 RepID=A0A7W6BNG8_9SPHN|nr:acyl-CoA synthetase (NDP forming) [Sphingobium jiangsuense]
MPKETMPAMPDTHSLNRLFAPRSIALVGAKDRSIWSVASFDNLKRFGFEGPVHLINPKGGTVHGQQAATSCAAVGEPIDAALLMVPEAALPEAMEDLRAANVGGAVILSAGFAETGEEGAERQRRVAALAREAGIRLIGPNCLGFANYVAKSPLWTTPLRRPMPGPTLAIVSQSGAVASQLEQFAYQQRIAVTHLISTGNEADVTIADAIGYLAQQPEPRSIALFLETIRDPAGFRAAVEAANAAGKPVTVLKVGSSEAAAAAAQTHTGSLVGDDSVFDALCRDLGIARVHSLEDLIVTSDLFARLGRIGGRGMSLIAMSGGMCEIALDQAEKEGVTIPRLAPPTLAALRETLPAFATPSNPLDLTGGAMLAPELIASSIAEVAKDPAIDVIGFVFDAPLKDDGRGFARRFVEHVGQGFSAAGKPCLMMSHTFMPVNGYARELADELGMVYSGGGVDGCLRALGHLTRPAALPRPAARQGASPAPAERPTTERAVLDHLARHGVPVVPGPVVGSAAEAVQAAGEMGYPVVLKIASPDIAHKTEAGGVRLNLQDAEAVAAAHDAIFASVRAYKPDAAIDGVIVSPMRRGGVELFAGTMRDPQWGPVLAIGFGGIFVEVLKDVSQRLLPVSEADVLEMLGELRGAPMLDGFRGAPPVDRTAVAKAIVAIGEAALALGHDLLSLEVNPLLVEGSRVEALDGLTNWDK